MATPLVITVKQHDTLPVARLVLREPDPTVIPQTNPPTMRLVDLTLAVSAKLLAKAQGGSDTFSSVLGFDVPRTSGATLWTPAPTDTDMNGTYDGEVEVTFSGGVETFPCDGYITIVIKPDLG